MLPIIRSVGSSDRLRAAVLAGRPIHDGVLMRHWLSTVYQAVVTVAQALWVCLRYWLRTYNPRRGTFTEQYEYPELPAKIYPRFRGFHRYDLTTCIACERCARRLPGRLHLHRQRACGGSEGLSDHQLHDRLRQVHAVCDLHRELPGRLHFHGLLVRSELLQPGGRHRRFFAASASRWPGGVPRSMPPWWPIRKVIARPVHGGPSL